MTVEKPKVKNHTADEIPIGSVFEYANNSYMRLSAISLPINEKFANKVIAANLETGGVLSLETDVAVISKPKSKVVVV